MPRFRTEDYAIWSACERFHIRPPGVEQTWDGNNVQAQSELIAFNQIRQYEEMENANQGQSQSY